MYNYVQMLEQCYNEVLCIDILLSTTKHQKFIFYSAEISRYVKHNLHNTEHYYLYVHKSPILSSKNRDIM